MWFIDLISIAGLAGAWVIVFLWTGKRGEAKDGVVDIAKTIEEIRKIRKDKS